MTPLCMVCWRIIMLKEKWVLYSILVTPPELWVSSPSFHNWKNFLEVLLGLRHTQGISVSTSWCFNKFAEVFMKSYWMNDMLVCQVWIALYVGFKMLAFLWKLFAVWSWQSSERIKKLWHLWPYVFLLHITFRSIE